MCDLKQINLTNSCFVCLSLLKAQITNAVFRHSRLFFENKHLIQKVKDLCKNKHVYLHTVSTPAIKINAHRLVLFLFFYVPAMKPSEYQAVNVNSASMQELHNFYNIYYKNVLDPLISSISMQSWIYLINNNSYTSVMSKKLCYVVVHIKN